MLLFLRMGIQTKARLKFYVTVARILAIMLLSSNRNIVITARNQAISLWIVAGGLRIDLHKLILLLLKGPLLLLLLLKPHPHL